jgi:hypothetical protein
MNGETASSPGTWAYDANGSLFEIKESSSYLYPAEGMIIRVINTSSPKIGNGIAILNRN